MITQLLLVLFAVIVYGGFITLLDRGSPVALSFRERLALMIHLARTSDAGDVTLAPSSHLEILKGISSTRSNIAGEMRELDEKANTEKRALTDTESATYEEKRAALADLDKRAAANLEAALGEQRMTGGLEGLLGAMITKDKGDLVDTRSVGDRFTQAEGFEEARAKGFRGDFAVALEGVDHRAVTTATTTTGGAGTLVAPQRLDRMGQDILDRRVYLSDLLPSTPVNGSIQYVQDKTPLADVVGIAVEVAEGAAKPKAGITPALVTENMATIAAYVQFTRQVDADAPFLRGLLDGRLRYALKRRKDQQIISGNGVGANMLGLANRPDIITVVPGAAQKRAVTVRKAITAMELVDAIPEIVVLNPVDAELFDLTNESTAGLHAVNSFTDDGRVARRPWGLTPIHSNGVAAGTALLIDPLTLLILDRMQPTAYMTDSHSTNFVENILTLLLELRAGLALFAAAGVCKVTFNGDE